MLRSFYLMLATTVMVAPCGCTASALWLADDSARESEGSLRDLRAGSAIQTDDLAKHAQPDKTADRIAEQKADDSADATLVASAVQPDAGNAGKLGRDAAAARSSAGGSMVDSRQTPVHESTPESLVEEVRALGFNDPQEEASALAALRAAPMEHRGFLLRTMQASAAVRKQHEGRERISQPSGKNLREGSASERELTVTPRFATMRSNERSYDRKLQRQRDPYVDPNTVAVIEVEPAEELPDVIHAASHSDDLRSAVAESTLGPPQTSPMANESGMSAATWQADVHAAIAALEAQLVGVIGIDRATLDAKLRLLYLLADRRDDALRSRIGTSTAEQEFWSSELYGLATLLDSRRQPDARQRAALASPHLRQAAERLGELGGLVVKNLHFCTEVKGYGSFVGFSQDEFRPGQEVLLYCEVENFRSELREKGYHTALKARYEVFDSSGQRIAEKDLGLKEEHCQNHRRDFFVPYFILMPKQAPPGNYQLKLTLEDVHAGETAEATIEFGIKGK